MRAGERLSGADSASVGSRLGAMAGLDVCIHCGFCLPACPTYRLTGEEAESPRGRIFLMGLFAEGEAAPSEVAGHLDSCLGCLGCVDACPSGVPYGRLVEAARSEVEAGLRRTRRDRWTRRVIFAVFPFRQRVRLAAALAVLARRTGLLGLAERIGVLDRLPLFGTLHGLLPDTSLRRLARGGITSRRFAGSRTLPAATPRLRVGLLAGCVQDALLPEVNEAAWRVLQAEGCETIVPATQGCCGALMLHAGRREPARAAARRIVDAFEPLGLDALVVTSAGCGSVLKEYGELLAGDPVYGERAARLANLVEDVTELLAKLEPQAPRHPIAGSVAYHDACHLSHAQGVRAAPRQLLATVPGLRLAEVPDGETCCGSAGIYNLVRPETAETLGKAKAAAVRSTGASLVAAGNPGCLLQLRRHLGPAIRVLHPVEIVDASIRGATLEGVDT
jgi:glycolate oxidase iron-sulfur subunit